MILLTGFNRFGDLDVNPSELILESIAGRTRASGRTDLVTEVLPTEYRRAGNRLCELIREFKPRAILGLGAAMGTRTLRLERVALNLDDSNEPDNAGEIARGRSIEPHGPMAYGSSLPLTRMHEALDALGVPAVISNHAGTFLCNHIFYVSRHHVERLGIPCQCGFIHVPATSAHVRGDSHCGMPLSLMVEGIECCLDVLRGKPVSHPPASRCRVRR
jgi:pyroglutamyl-peptidase